MLQAFLQKNRLLFILLFSITPVCAQYTNDTVAVTIKPYVGLRGHFAIYDQKMEIQDNASRAGVQLSVKKGEWQFIAGTEFQINMFKGGTSFNVDGNASGDFLVLQAQQTQQVFGSRLGYLGVELEQYGSLTIGKQWSVYRDITAYTDQFTVFGRRASATFIGGTDGGENGTGRADQSLLYRNRFGPVSFGAQLQARGTHNGKFIDGYGFSSQLRLREGLFVGIAYNKALLSTTLIDNHQVIGLNGNPEYLAVGARYNGPKIELSLIMVRQKNGDFAQGVLNDETQGILKPTVVFNAKGFEVFGKYKFEKVSLLAGYNLYIPDTDAMDAVAGQKPVSSDFKTSDCIIGAVYSPFAMVQLYAEQRFSLGKTALGTKEASVVTFGLKIDIAKTYTKKVEL